MTIQELENEARTIWGNSKIEVLDLPVLLGVVYGDICRQARNSKEGTQVDQSELKKELGNVIFSTIRWCSELGLEPEECIKLAKTAQVNYQKALRP